MTRVVVDTDPGTDDAIALIMALNSPEVHVEGVTTVGGNASLDHTTDNALRLLDYLGYPHVNAYPGSASAMRGSYRYAYDFHGPGGLTVDLPASRREPESTRAHEYIVDVASRLRGGVVVVALGPLTNLAKAFRLEPRTVDRIEAVVVMGGAVNVPGNMTPHAEFNVYNDPAAAAVVFSSGVPITLVGLDVCNETVVHRRDLPWPNGASLSGGLVRRILDNWFETHPNDSGYSLCDPLAMAALVRPDLLDFEKATVAVEARDPERLGKTTAAYGKGNVQVAVGVRAPEAKELIRELVEGPGGIAA